MNPGTLNPGTFGHGWHRPPPPSPLPSPRGGLWASRCRVPERSCPAASPTTFPFRLGVGRVRKCPAHASPTQAVPRRPLGLFAKALARRVPVGAGEAGQLQRAASPPTAGPTDSAGRRFSVIWTILRRLAAPLRVGPCRGGPKRPQQARWQAVGRFWDPTLASVGSPAPSIHRDRKPRAPQAFAMAELRWATNGTRAFPNMSEHVRAHPATPDQR